MATQDASKKKAQVKRPTALKRHLQNLRRRARNRAYKAQIKGALRTAELQLQKSNVEEHRDAVKSVYSLLDRGVKRGVLKVNKAARLKARFAAQADRKQTA